MFILLALRNEGRNEGLAASPTSISKSVTVSKLCVLCVSAFSSPDLSPFNSNPSTRNLAFLVDALDAASSLSPLFATLTKNTGGWGTPSFSANSVPSALKSARALPPTDLFAAQHHPPHCFSFFHQSPVTSHHSQVTKSFTIRTYAKCARNPCRMNTSKTQDLKLFRINTYKKNGEGYYPRLQTRDLAETRNHLRERSADGSALAVQARVAGMTRPSRLKDEACGAGVRLAAAAPDITWWKASWKRSISDCVPTVMRTCVGQAGRVVRVGNMEATPNDEAAKKTHERVL
jgi:hypothetical protein